ncbi:hypothetical protein ACP275_11G033300 [Erythranthe tilingii]
MEEERNRSSGALPVTEIENSTPLNWGEEEIRDEIIIEKIDEQRPVLNYAAGNNSGGESKAPEFETLASVQLPEGDLQADFDESSHLLSEVPVEYSLQPLKPTEEIEDQVTAMHDESLKCITGQSAELVVQHQMQAGAPNSIVPTPKLQSAENGNNLCLTENYMQNSPDPKPLAAAMPTQKTPSDGYNWRKYGQKQVKSPEGSRSYYRCTFSDCCAKKIECSDRSNRLIETVYRSHHNHDPPQKMNCTRENRPSLAIVPSTPSKESLPSTPLKESLPSTPLKESLPSIPLKESLPPTPSKESLPPIPSKEALSGAHDVPEIKQQESSDSDQTTETNAKEEYADGSESRKRQKSNSADVLESLPKPGKKSKYVVHAAVDVGISGDGYRWRKYGQKMVKGNPHPRNYYRCTSAGCPVRKHIESAVDNANAVVITYKGMHDHDTPVPRKRHSPKSATTHSPRSATHWPKSATANANANAATANAASSPPVPLDDLQNKTNPHSTSRTQWSVSKEGELTGEAMNVAGEKESGSARTLLSVGFEIKPC